MARVSYGTVDGRPAKIVYHPGRRQTHVYWGGMEGPDGIGHNHATIQDTNPDTFHFLRVGSELIVNQSYDPNDRSRRAREQKAKFDLAATLRKVLGWYGLR
jgi:hypothetical protein